MKIHHLDARTIHSAFLTACDFIVIHRENLNAINVFPVADGDTGDNMSATAMAIMKHSSVKPSINETIQSIANAALIGARGNSGMIFSQFFNGLTEIKIDRDEIDTITFAELVTRASQSVRASILHPVEGTIITVIDAWAQSISSMAAEFTCFKQLIQQTLGEVNQALQNTTNTLAVLKDTQVVDAGALGFYHFISGFADYLHNPRIIDVNDLHEDCGEHHELPAHGEPPEQRYCTEIMLEGDAIDRDLIAHQLEQFGDSIVSSGNKQLCRFHVHCVKPATVFESLFEVGKITQSKAEDMLRQYQMIYQRKHSIALVTDSSADLPQALLDEHQIHIIQLNMHLDGHNLLDRICVNQHNFYDHLASLKTYPKTSFPSPALLEQQIKHLAAQYDEVLILPLAQALSGTHDAICKASEQLTNVTVVDSCSTSASLGLLVNYAAELIAQELPLEQIKSALMAKRSKINLFVYVDNFESMIRSGRINKISGRIAQFAHVKPIISLNPIGKGVLFDKAFTEHGGLNKVIHCVEKAAEGTSLQSYAIVHAGVPEKAEHFAQLTTKAFGQAPAFIEYTSTAIGLHAGKGSIAVASIMN